MRCYNGCPDSELAAIWKERDDKEAEMKALGEKLGMRLICTYFPMEGNYECCDCKNGYRPITDFVNSKITALDQAINFLMELHKQLRNK